MAGFIDIVPPPWLTICKINPGFLTTLPTRSVILYFLKTSGQRGVDGPTMQTSFAFMQYEITSSIV